MPFDGKGFEHQVEQDEVLALLSRARERVAQGWGRIYYQRNDKVCALGAIARETPLLPGSGTFWDTLNRRNDANLALYDALPARWSQRYSKTEEAIGFFNDCLWPWQKWRVLRLFDRAIAQRAAGG